MESAGDRFLLTLVLTEHILCPRYRLSTLCVLICTQNFKGGIITPQLREGGGDLLSVAQLVKDRAVISTQASCH